MAAKKIQSRAARPGVSCRTVGLVLVLASLWGCSSDINPEADGIPAQCLNLLYSPAKLQACCPDSAPPDCSTKPDGYPGFGCTPNCAQYPDAGFPCSGAGSYCTCSCQGGSWQCGC